MHKYSCHLQLATNTTRLAAAGSPCWSRGPSRRCWAGPSCWRAASCRTTAGTSHWWASMVMLVLFSAVMMIIPLPLGDVRDVSVERRLPRRGLHGEEVGIPQPEVLQLHSQQVSREIKWRKHSPNRRICVQVNLPISIQHLWSLLDTGRYLFRLSLKKNFFCVKTHQVVNNVR